MNRTEWLRVKRILGDALDLTPCSQRAHVEAESHGDPAIARDVLRLIERDRGAGSFLGQAGPSSFGRARPRWPAGHVLAQRYEITGTIGEGAWGMVYDARDRLTHASVAVKALADVGEDGVRALRHEAAALRWLRLPGVVRLLDDGVENGLGYIVMERVFGTPFPGEGRTRDWESICDTVVALAETLARVHWAGVIHRDLKPTNVLVDASGRPTLLDLGVSVGAPVDWDPAHYFELAGTPLYVAPEQALGAPPTASSDLYSLGIMIFEALAGAIPHVDGPAEDFFQRRTMEPARPLADAAAGVPRHVGDLVDDLLRRLPEQRPPSAVAVAAHLRRSPSRLDANRPLPWLGSERPILRVVDAARRRVSIDVSGPPGSGRTRCIEEARERLTRAGFEVVALPPGGSPYESLSELVPPASPEANADDVRTHFGSELRRLLGSGLVLAADDCMKIDSWSLRLLEDCRAAGSVVRSMPAGQQGAVDLEPIPEHSLRTLFAGPDRVLHIREDAAQELWRRTDGWPAAVAAELHSWVQGGLARREDDTFVVTRGAIDRIVASESVRDVVNHERILTPREEEMLGCIELAGSKASITMLAQTLKCAEWQVETELRELALRGVVTLSPDGGIRPNVTVRHRWSSGRQRAIHEALGSAEPPGTPERVRHLLLACKADEVATEAPLAAARLLQIGKVQHAATLVEEGLRAFQRAGLRRDPTDLLAVGLRVALASGTSSALDHIVYEAQRVHSADPAVRWVETIAKAGLLTLEGDGRRALALLSDTCPASLRSSFEAVRVLAARYASAEEEARAVDQATEWAAADGSSAARAAALHWRAWLWYRRGAYDRAHDTHLEAADAAPDEATRLSALVSAAEAALEAYRLGEAARLGELCKESACSLRNAVQEARAECVLRAVAYRTGEASVPDTELVEAIGALGVPQLQAAACLTEAAVSWRTGRRGLARDLADSARRWWTDAGLVWPALVAASLAEICGAKCPDLAMPDPVAAAVPGLALQVLGLQAMTGHPQSPEAAASLLRRIPESQRRWRREVISAEEALHAIMHKED